MPKEGTSWLWLAFVVGAFLSWGCYVPTLHEGQKVLGGGVPRNGAFRAFLCVGLAYFVAAVVIPAILLWRGVEPASMSPRGFSFAFLGGLLGAAGALCIIFALRTGGTPMWVPPLVFAGAPIVNAIISTLWHPPAERPGWPYWVGIVLAALGAGMVLVEKGRLDKVTQQKVAAAKAAAHAHPGPV